ncbi:J domain-containing protein [Albimonas sp. CAU 1670]|uniref:J domain-containing protein n=1 Tax=Albimonas sp. CAU 1670 TaxID=3032599 RepID=UPI0023DCB30A|nr:J domain-containing protein [Albimonas sp. CAU 1670]MDF2231985.1 J domain-containing protein [Albimonas sp. CAU 1670]
MPRRSFLDYDVSVSADKARRARRRGHTGAFEGGERQCECEGCEEAGLYRAPRAPDDLENFHWFCLEHVREYNRAWNYFRDRSEEEVEDYLRHATVWDRPTWRIGKDGKPHVSANGHAEGQAWRRFGYNDPFQVLGENATINPGKAQPDAPVRPRRRLLPANERRALEILGVEDEAGRDAIRTRYKSLVKDLHPDMNGGRRDAEDRLSKVIWAWEQIKTSRNFPA